MMRMATRLPNLTSGGTLALGAGKDMGLTNSCLNENKISLHKS